ncbi:MAG: hypothetical protein GXP17_08075 [Gammaproteobacteria bacterium]|nr:hypothetical protein [Gammaproteobacteria bacterium]
MAEYKKQTNEIHEVSLESAITHAFWQQKYCMVGDSVRFEVHTHFVGNGSEIKIKFENKKGKKIEKLSGGVYGDYYSASVVIPKQAEGDIVFVAKLSKHGLEMKSDILRVISVTNLKWGVKEARRGDVVKLTADVAGMSDGSEVGVYIYEYDQNGAHDFVTTFPATVQDGKLETDWEYDYHEDTDEIPTDEEMKQYGGSYSLPEYFFVLDVKGGRFGKDQESSLLQFKDWIEITLIDDFEEVNEDIKYELDLPDGSTRKGQLDPDGMVKEEDVPPGKVIVRFPVQ